jgi:hypothetical protein
VFVGSLCYWFDLNGNLIKRIDAAEVFFTLQGKAEKGYKAGKVYSTFFNAVWVYDRTIYFNHNMCDFHFCKIELDTEYSEIYKLRKPKDAQLLTLTADNRYVCINGRYPQRMWAKEHIVYDTFSGEQFTLDAFYIDFEKKCSYYKDLTKKHLLDGFKNITNDCFSDDTYDSGMFRLPSVDGMHKDVVDFHTDTIFTGSEVFAKVSIFDKYTKDESPSTIPEGDNVFRYNNEGWVHLCSYDVNGRLSHLSIQGSYLYLAHSWYSTYGRVRIDSGVTDADWKESHNCGLVGSICERTYKRYILCK